MKGRKIYGHPAQADAMDLARMLANAHIRTVIINTDHREEEKLPLVWGKRIDLKPTAFLIELARVTKGRYYGLETIRVTQTR